MRKRKRLGEMLVEEGLMTDAQITAALAGQKSSKLKLGQYLVREGIINESQIVDVIAKQLRLDKYDPMKYPLDLSLSNVIKADVSQKYQIAPLVKTNFLLTIAMTDPMDIDAIDVIEEMANIEVEAVICTEKELNNLTSSLYGSYASLGGVLEGMEEMQFESVDETRDAPPPETMGIGSLQDMAEDAPVIRLVNSILSQAIRGGASDVHLSPEKNFVQVRFRIDGKLQEVPAPSKSMFLPIASRIKILSNMDIAVSRIPQDGRFAVNINNKEINIRASALPTIHGENIVLRLLDTSGGITSLENLGMSPADREKIESCIVKPYGMILSTGPTGSGKTTTLYSVLKKLNQPDINIITLEDPVEYRLDKIRQVQLNTKAGMTFSSGLRSILRQDPDVIMVGEIRDVETARIAVQAAMTGHRLLSTVHTNDAAGAITRFIDMGIEPFLVSSVMLVAIAQRLIRKVCPYCSEPYTPAREALQYWGLTATSDANFVRAKGCVNCMETGYKGRSGIYEVLVIDGTIQDMILHGKSSQEITRTASNSGALRTLKDDAAEKIKSGVTTLEEAVSAVMG
ncbi:MAG: ATPase, T2SS/T4P/T4SS family [Desulfobacterales bacterium]|nr:ATPase, T2SS/T4P/T4SS family [Desulfobacterales bacterium]